MTEVLKRDEWLTKAMEKIIEKVFKPHAELVMPPRLTIAAGLMPGKAIGVCTDPDLSDDATVHIWITPEHGKDDVMQILATIVHELCHATCCGQGYSLKETGHGHPFNKFIRDVGLEGKPKRTTCNPGTELWATLEGIAADLGPYDHAPFRKAEKKTRQSMNITLVSESDAEFEVKVKFPLVYEHGMPKDYNGQPMVAKDKQKWLELEELFLSSEDLNGEQQAEESTN